MVPGELSLATADLVLLLMAIPLLVSSLVGLVFSVQMGIALGAGSVPASGTLGYALFYDPPTS